MIERQTVWPALRDGLTVIRRRLPPIVLSIFDPPPSRQFQPVLFRFVPGLENLAFNPRDFDDDTAAIASGRSAVGLTVIFEH
jgi:hypothetical protein